MISPYIAAVLISPKSTIAKVESICITLGNVQLGIAIDISLNS